jgi:hypothetical protein
MVAELSTLSPADTAEKMLIAGVPGIRTLTKVDLPEENYFAPGVYARGLFRKAGTMIVGAEHTQAHLSILLFGKLRILADGKVREVTGPSKPMFCQPGRKVTFALEDSYLITFHPNPQDETDLKKLEDALVKWTPALLEFEEKQRLLGDSL